MEIVLTIIFGLLSVVMQYPQTKMALHQLREREKPKEDAIIIPPPTMDGFWSKIRSEFNALRPVLVTVAIICFFGFGTFALFKERSAVDSAEARYVASTNDAAKLKKEVDNLKAEAASRADLTAKPQVYLKMKSIQCIPPMDPNFGGVYPFRLGVNVNDKLVGTLPFELLAFGGMTNAVDEQDVVPLQYSDQYSVMFSLQKAEQPGSESNLKFTNIVNNASRPVFFKTSELPIGATNRVRLLFPMFGKHLEVVYEMSTNQ